MPNKLPKPSLSTVTPMGVAKTMVKSTRGLCRTFDDERTLNANVLDAV